MEAKQQKRNNNDTPLRKGIRGVALKSFEGVIVDILSLPSPSPSSSEQQSINLDVLPCYLPLPTLPTKDRFALISSGIKSNSPSDVKQISIDEHENQSVTRNKPHLPALEWPFSILPDAVHVRCTPAQQKNARLIGKLSGVRALRKEHQLRSLLQCVFAMLPSSAFGFPEEATKDSNSNGQTKKIRIVDFAGGTGHLALPLSLLLPKCEIVLVDLKAASLEFVHKKAEDLRKKSQSPPILGKDIVDDESEGLKTNRKKKVKKRRIKPSFVKKEVDVTFHENTMRQCRNIPNLFTFHGSISSYVEYSNDFDIGIALHACGEATDLVLRACGESEANFIVSPCCVGKLSSQTHNPYIYHATATNEPTISYPQSSGFCKCISRSSNSSKDMFDILAKAADYSEMQDMRTCRNATRRTAKSLLEMDRLLFMKETYHYDHVVLTRMDPWEASPKNDILMGWIGKRRDKVILSDPYYDSHGGVENVQPCCECNADAKSTIDALVSPNCENLPDFLRDIRPGLNDKVNKSSSITDGKPNTNDMVNWTEEEEESLTKILQEFVQNGDSSEKRFPTGMGPRKRKLVHYLAEKMNLRHWGEGRKGTEKIVVVAINLAQMQGPSPTHNRN